MKKNYIFTLLLTFLSLVSYGQVILAEDFSYPDGSLIPNGGWANNSGTAGTFLVSSGQAVVQHATGTEDARKTFASVSGDVYAAFDFSVDNLAGGITGTDFEYFAHLGFNARVDIVAPNATGDFTLGISTNTSTAQATWGSDLSFATTYRVVIKYDQVGGVATLWVNPVVEGDTSISGDVDTTPGTITAFDLRQSTSSSGETVRVDNLMIGQTFNDVVAFVPQTDPALSVGGVSEGQVLSPETTSVSLSLTVDNFDVQTPSAGDGYIVYTVNSDPSVDKFDTTDIALSSLTPGNYTVVVELVDNSGASLSPVVSQTINFSIAAYNVVADLAALRAGTEGDYYEITGEVVLTYARTSRNQKYIQDASAGVLIDDNDGIITTVYNVNDGITGLKGRLGSFSGVTQFIPSVDPGAASSTGNTITPEIVTLADFEANSNNYESELIEIQNVTFTAADGVATFAASNNYEISSGGTLSNFRTNFSEADYIGTVIQSGTQSIVVLGGEFNGDPQVTAIELAGFTLGLEENQIEGFAIFPNPVKDEFTVRTSLREAGDVIIYNILGKEVLKTKVSPANRNVNVTNLNSGIYLLKVVENGKTATKKLVIK